MADASYSGEGWRYATRAEVCDLLERESGAAFPDGCPSPFGAYCRS